MLEKIQPACEKFLGRISAAAQSKAWLVAIVATVCAGLAGSYVIDNVRINTDTENMLSEKLAWRTTYADYKRDFPYFADNITVVVDAATRDLAEDAARTLAETLAKETDHFNSVFHPSEQAFFRENQLLYLSTDEIAELADELSQAQPFLARLTPAPNLGNLFSILEQAVTNIEDTNETFVNAIHSIASAITEVGEEQYIPLSWQKLIGGSISEATEQRVIFLVRPKMDFGSILPAEHAIDLIRDSANALGLTAENGIKVRLTGGAALAHDEMESVISGSQRAGMLALLLVMVCLMIGLRSWELVLATLVTLVIGLVYTAAFAVFAVGTLNMISIAFAVLYVGLGVDFAIHICLRYQETLDGQSKNEALNRAARHVGTSIALCAVTTAVGFFAFIPTNYRGVAELGLIAGVGMFVSLFASLTILPAILQLLPVPKGKESSVVSQTAERSFLAFTISHAKPILVVAGCVWFAASLTVSFVSFDINPINLNNQNAESVKLFRELTQGAENDAQAISIVAESDRERIEIIQTLDRVASIKSIRSIESVIPDDQDAKLEQIDELSLVLGDDLELGDRGDLNYDIAVAEIDKLSAALDVAKAADGSTMAALTDLGIALREVRRILGSADDGERRRLIETLDAKLLASFPGRVSRLADSLNPSGVSIESLPSDMRHRWLSDKGRYRVEASPRGDLSDSSALRAFVRDVRGAVADRATGAAVINVGAGDAVKAAFIQAFCTAFLVIGVLLWLILRSFKEVCIAFFPLLLAGLLTASAVVFFGLSFNFANIIALPLLLGIGVDSSLHILHRYKTDLPSSGNILQTSTARAVLFSAATTAVSFGNLAISDHAGTASMGLVLTAGIAATLLCMLIVLPALLNLYVKRPVIQSH